MTNPFLKRQEERGKIGHGKLSEKKVLKKLGAQAQPNSGAMRGAKGDGTLKAKKTFKVESKSTVHATLSLDLGWLVKVAVEALNVGQTPALTMSFVGPDGKPRKHGEWVAIPLQDFRELTEEDE